MPAIPLRAAGWREQQSKVRASLKGWRQHWIAVTAAEAALPEWRVEVTIAHELGHLRHRRVGRIAVLYSCLLTLSALAVAGIYLSVPTGPTTFGWDSPVLAALLAATFALLAAMKRREESEADAFAACVVGVDAAARDCDLCAQEHPPVTGLNRWVAFHPSWTERAAAIRRLDSGQVQTP